MKQAVTENQRYALSKNDFFVKKNSVKFIINSVISTLFVFAGSLIDTLLVGVFLGDDGLSAMSLVSPVYLIFYTVGATVGIGASILASRMLGKGKIDEYRAVFTFSTVILAVAAVAMATLFFLLFDPLTDLLCGDVVGVQKEMFRQYLRYYIPGGACTLMTYVPLYFLKTDGRPKLSSRLFTLSAVMNIALTWLFMNPHLFNMGIGGASLATSLSMATVAVLGFILILRGKTELRFVKPFFSWDRLKNIVVSGVPNGMNNLLSSARILLINMLLISAGSAAFLSCYTVVRNISDVLNSVILGVSSAIIPLIGVMFGERDYAGSRSTFRYAMKVGITVMIPLVLLVSLLPDLVFRLFSVTDLTLINEGRWALPLSCVGLVAAYANTLYIGYLTAEKREWLATVLVALRLFVMLAFFAFPLSHWLSSKGIWVSLSLAEIGTLGIFYVIVWVIRKKHPTVDRFLIDTNNEHASDITFSVRNNANDIVFATEQISCFCEDNDIDMRKSMKVSLAIEEILTFLNTHCLDASEDNYTDVRVCKLENEVMLRFRYIGEIYDPTAYYQQNESNEEMQEELLGLKMIMKSASLVHFSQVLGANNLMVIF